MTQVNLPNRNITGDNLWSQVEDNDDAIADVVNGGLDNGNIAAAADINASKLLDGSITAAKLGTDSVTNVKINASAVDTAEIADSAVTTAKIEDGAVTNAKLTLTASTGTATNDSGVTGTITARKYADGLVLLEGSVSKSTGSWSSTTTVTTLPSGFRPSTAVQSIRPCSTDSGTGFIYVSIATTGIVTIIVGSPFTTAVTLANLGGITFQVA